MHIQKLIFNNWMNSDLTSRQKPVIMVRIGGSTMNAPNVAERFRLVMLIYLDYVGAHIYKYLFRGNMT